ncbi:MAG: SpoIID/LytB domain-containing protein [Armatimonadetes bacterium]|nr:SpoIID/LytB domain-containing protein [Candidatus Hippobium faecium]
MLICSLLVLCSLSVFASAMPDADDNISVSLTGINTDFLLVEPSSKIVFPYNMKVFDLSAPTRISVSLGLLGFEHKGKKYTSPNILVMGPGDVVRFTAKATKKYAYKGYLSLSVEKAKIKIINRVSLEEYVRTVLATEISPKADIEVIKAQAVAVRTWAVKKIEAENYHLCDTTHCQTYRGYSPNAALGKAVAETKGLILTYEKKPISAMYCTDCGGITSSWDEVYGKGRAPYLASAKDPFPVEHLKWKYEIKDTDLAKKVKLSSLETCVIDKKYSTGRVKTISFVSKKETKSKTGEEFRSLMGTNNIKSTLFAVSKKNNTFVFEGVGFGHCYGMCQKTAGEMGKRGWNYKKILLYFYKDTVLEKYILKNK